jgi:low affinity Fe/Cu permease
VIHFVSPYALAATAVGSLAAIAGAGFQNSPEGVAIVYGAGLATIIGLYMSVRSAQRNNKAQDAKDLESRIEEKVRLGQAEAEVARLKDENETLKTEVERLRNRRGNQ